MSKLSKKNFHFSKLSKSKLKNDFEQKQSHEFWWSLHYPVETARLFMVVQAIMAPLTLNRVKDQIGYNQKLEVYSDQIGHLNPNNGYQPCLQSHCQSGYTVHYHYCI